MKEGACLKTPVKCKGSFVVVVVVVAPVVVAFVPCCSGSMVGQSCCVQQLWATMHVVL